MIKPRDNIKKVRIIFIYFLIRANPDISGPSSVTPRPLLMLLFTITEVHVTIIAGAAHCRR